MIKITETLKKNKPEEVFFSAGMRRLDIDVDTTGHGAEKSVQSEKTPLGGSTDQESPRFKKASRLLSTSGFKPFDPER